MRKAGLLTLWIVLAAGAALAQAEPPVQAVTVASARTGEVRTQVVVSGTLVPREEVSVIPKIAGQEIVEIAADLGDLVEAQQVLARLDDQSLRAQLAQAEATLASAEAGVAQAEAQLASARAGATQAGNALERTRALSNRGDAAQATLDQAVANADSAEANVGAAQAGLSAARAQVQQAEAARDLARLNLSWTEIRSPVAGTVLSRAANLGALSASGGAPLFVIAAGSEVEVAAEVIESDLERIAVGDPATVEVTGMEPLSGEIRQISPEVDPATRLGAVRITLPDLPEVRTGLFARAAIVTDRREALTVPASAVLNADSGDYVQLVEDGVVDRRAVSLGALSEGRREVLDGLAEGDTVIARAGAFFRAGDRVDPVPAEEPKP